jgi:hypothetical protein
MTFVNGNATNFQDFPREQFDRVIAVFMLSYLSRADMTAVFPDRTLAPRPGRSFHFHGTAPISALYPSSRETRLL